MPPPRNINRHAHLVRASVLAVKAMQAAADKFADNSAEKTLIELALTAMGMALHGQRMHDEKVVIGIIDGMPYIESQTEFVEVTIKKPL